MAAQRWRFPPFDQLAHYAPLFELPWDETLAQLNVLAAQSLRNGLSFVEQDPHLAADGMSYEQRIGERALIAMRRDSLHDLYGALMWLQWPHSKWAIHRGQWAGVLAVGPKQRTRHQQALTHIDEAGLVLVTADSAILERLLAHDWRGLLLEQRADWSKAQVFAIGHALFELRQSRPHDLQASKVIAVLQNDRAWFDLNAGEKMRSVDQRVATAIAEKRAVADPKDQSTLPLAAIVGWDERNIDPDFISSAPCFRPKPAGRAYARPLRF